MWKVSHFLSFYFEFLKLTKSKLRKKLVALLLLLAELFHRSYQERSLETNLESDCRRPWMLGQSLDLWDLSFSPFFSDLTVGDSARLPLSLPDTLLNQHCCEHDARWSASRPLLSYYRALPCEWVVLLVKGAHSPPCPWLRHQDTPLSWPCWDPASECAGLQGRPWCRVTWAGNVVPKNSVLIL